MKIIVFDDDPTGSQTVHDCLLLLSWDYQTLLDGIKSGSRLLFILCNTRSLSEAEASQRLIEICTSLKQVINSEGYSIKDFVFISRGDSTLRGHNFLEPFVINKALGPFDATFHIPAFIEGDRLTINGRHFVDNMPAHETIFAKDKIFGYQTNNIKQLLYKKSKFQIQLKDIENLTLSEINELVVNENNIIFKKIRNLKNNKQLIVDADTYWYLDKFSLVLNKLKMEKNFFFRTAASFIKSYSRIENNTKDNKYYSQLRRKDDHNKYMKGLIVIGSHVELSSIQLKSLLEISTCKPIEINVKDYFQIFKYKNEESQIKIFKKRLVNQVRECIKKDFTPVLFTSRKVLISQSNDEEFAFNKSLASFIAQIIKELKLEIGYLISKGGITTNTILSEGFSANSVYLEGQITIGISLLSVHLKQINTSIPVVTFPGNIGDKNTMVKVWSIIENQKISSI